MTTSLLYHCFMLHCGQTTGRHFIVAVELWCKLWCLWVLTDQEYNLPVVNIQIQKKTWQKLVSNVPSGSNRPILTLERVTWRSGDLISHVWLLDGTHLWWSRACNPWKGLGRRLETSSKLQDAHSLSFVSCSNMTRACEVRWQRGIFIPNLA